jgi:putative ABC transport system substrate-binding protein
MRIVIARRRLLSMTLTSLVGWPVLAAAQQAATTGRAVGILIGYARSADDSAARQVLQPLKEGLLALGWAEGSNIRYQTAFGAGDLNATNKAADNIVSAAPNLIYAVGLPAARAVLARTNSIPVIFTQVADPVGFGLVSALAHPTGNATGFMSWDLSIGGKWLELLREAVPDMKRAGVVYNPDTGPYAAGLLAAARAAAADKVEIVDCPVHDDASLEARIASFAGGPRSGIIVVPEPFTNSHQTTIIETTAQNGLPAIMSFAGAVQRGALISYTYATDDILRLPTGYIDRILRGTPPGSLPVQAPSKLELSINLRTAAKLGLTLPTSLLAGADEIIE